jgi:hypothetical protein
MQAHHLICISTCSLHAMQGSELLAGTDALDAWDSCLFTFLLRHPVQAQYLNSYELFALFLVRLLCAMQGSELLAGSDALDAWESCLFHSRHLKRAVEDLGAAMYPPQVRG